MADLHIQDRLRQLWRCELADVADVQPGVQPVYTIVRANGKPAVLLNIARQPSSNTVQVADEVAAEVERLKANLPAGVVICSARLGTRDLEATVEWWAELDVPVWGIIPERVSIAAGPSARLSFEGLDLYGQVLKKAMAKLR